MFAAQAARGAEAKKNGQPDVKQAAAKKGTEAQAPAAAANAPAATASDATREPLGNVVDNKKGADADAAIAPPAKKQCLKAQDATTASGKAVSSSSAAVAAADSASSAEEEARPQEAAAEEASKAAPVDVTEPSAQCPSSSGGAARAEKDGEKSRKKAKVAGSSLLDKPASSPRTSASLEVGDAKTPPVSSTAESAEVESAVRPRTHIVKERVREEHQYMDERGYMVTEEVVVERDVEKELPAAPTLLQKAAPAVKARTAVSEPSADPAGGRKKKGKGDKPQALQGSITSFFAKK